MKIRALRALRGPNYYSQRPMIFMELDIGELEEKPTDTIPDFRANIEKLLPTLYEHRCSPGVAGGFFQRIERGTWPGHVAEHIAIELQRLIGHDITFGKTFTLKEKGVYNVVYRYIDERVGLRAGEMAVALVEDLYRGIVNDPEPLLKELRGIAKETRFGPSTQSIVDEAARRGISHIQLNEHSYVQLGQGKFQRRIEATLMDNTSALGVEIAANKERTKQILDAAGVPVPRGRAVDSLEEACTLAEELGYPLVIKPLSGNHGRGVSIKISDQDRLEEAFALASQYSRTVVVEKYLEGFDFRFLVIDGVFQAAAMRRPAYVVGDGIHSIQQLIDIVNEDPNRGRGHEKVLTRIQINGESLRVLEGQGYSLDCVPEAEEMVFIHSTANISSGGTAMDITDRVHPLNQRMAERIARLIGLNVTGIDIIAQSVDQPITRDTGGVVEVNAGPGLRMHLHPSEGTPRNVAEPIVDMLFPEGASHSVPICAVTGTNGKTTVTRLISHILGFTGCTVGMTSTDAVVVDNIPILFGDYSGPEGAKTVMKDVTIDHAVLEIARGGILRRGLGFDTCDVGVFLNVSSDHLGYGGIDTLDQLTRLKSTVTESVKEDGFAIFNADDPLVLAAVRRSGANPILFSKDRNHPALKENLKNGHCNVTLKEDMIVLQKPGGTADIAHVNEVPITFEGQALFNVENVMAATGAAYALGINEEQIRAGLISFSPSIGQSPGRMNVIDIGDFKVLIDYGHNIGAVRATGDFIQNLMPGKKIRMVAGVGNRRTEDLLDFGEAVGAYADEIIISDPSPRNRRLGETAELVQEGLIRGGFDKDHIRIILEEGEAVQAALQQAGPGDLVVLQVENIQQVIQDVLEYKKEFGSQIT